jgi:hypothetical protein
MEFLLAGRNTPETTSQKRIFLAKSKKELGGGGKFLV